MRRSLTVLHVDDDQDFLELTKQYLGKKLASTSITSVTGPDQGLQLLDRGEFDAVISDYRMQGMTGLELLEQLRENGNDVPFIMLTGKGREEIVIQALNLGADYYLQKGSDSKVLFTELAHFLATISKQKHEREKRERAEKALTVERNQLLAIFDSMDYQINVTDPVTCEILYANRALKELLGKDPTGWKCYEVFHESEHPCDSCLTAKTLETEGVTYQWDYYNPCFDRYYVMVGRIIRWPDGRSAWLEIGIDITDRKHIEQALQGSEERFRKIFEEGPAGMAITDLDYRFTRINSRFCRMLGYGERELLDRPFSVITLPGQLEEDVKQVERLLKGELPYYRTVKRYVKKNGGTTWGAVTVSLIRDERGNPVHFLVMAENLNEYRRIIRQIPECGESFPEAEPIVLSREKV